MTALRFSGGEVIEVNLSLEEVRKLLQKALGKGMLLELEAPSGDTIIINPQQVTYLQNGVSEVFPPPRQLHEATGAARDASTASQP